MKSLAAFFDRPGTCSCALRLATQCVSYKRQDRNDSERKWTASGRYLLTPRPDISPPYVSLSRLYSTTTPGFRGYLVARFVKLLSTTSDHLDYYGIKKNHGKTDDPRVATRIQIIRSDFSLLFARVIKITRYALLILSYRRYRYSSRTIRRGKFD